MDNFQSSILSDRLNTILKELKQMNQKLDRIIYRTSKRGFSLVELMIVVAVLGILAAIAIPNFQRFQARSRQTEAKAGLSAIHTAEHAFHAEWEVYAGALQPIGWVPDGKEFRYAIGFNAAQQGFCGANTNIAVAAMLNCGPAPGRLYRGNAENVGITLTGGVATTSYGGMSGGASVANEITFVGSDAAAATISDTTTDTANANEGMFTGTDAAPHRCFN